MDLKFYRLLVELVALRPNVWRRILVPADLTFAELHASIQISMGWLDFHLYEFWFPGEKLLVTEKSEPFEEYKYYSELFKGRKPVEEEDPDGSIRKILSRSVKQPHVRIEKYLERNRSAGYLYDFGDRWEHKITLEEILEDNENEWPRVLAGEGACPPEDVGGPTGYALFLDAWNRPENPEHEALRIWGKAMHYDAFDIDQKNRLLAARRLMTGKQTAFVHPRTLLRREDNPVCTCDSGDTLVTTDRICINKLLPCGELGFNLTALRKYCETNREKIREITIDIRRWDSLHPCEMDEREIEAADTAQPVLLVEIAPDYFELDESIDPDSSFERTHLILDGRCRMEKARRAGQKTIRACALKAEQHSGFIVSGYDRFVEYWNRELDYLP